MELFAIYCCGSQYSTPAAFKRLLAKSLGSVLFDTSIQAHQKGQVGDIFFKIFNETRRYEVFVRRKGVILKHDMYKCDHIFFTFWDISFRCYSLVSVPKSEASARYAYIFFMK